MTLSKRLKDKMKECRLTQEKLAEEVGITQQAIGRLTRGDSKTSAHMHKIAKALGTTSEYLLGETDDPNPAGLDVLLSVDEQDWLNLLRKLSAEQRQAVLQLAKSLSGS
jgi:transcriptional regulator with XRE-family HTH domain